MTRVFRLAYLLVPLLFLGSCKAVPAIDIPVEVMQVPKEADGLPLYENPIPDAIVDHHPDSFTQGLAFFSGKLYESTGRIGKSAVQRLDPSSGKIELDIAIDHEFFGEGLTFHNGRFYQLTWQNGVCLVYTPELELESTLFYNNQGWGLASHPEKDQLLFTDGSDVVRFIDPHNFITVGKISVTDGNGQPVNYLNELEWVNGELWANVWMSDAIARIDPETGRVNSWIKLPELVAEHAKNIEMSLNGIAYDPESDTLWLTGKLWPVLYRYDRVTERFFTPPDRPQTDSLDHAH